MRRSLAWVVSAFAVAGCASGGPPGDPVDAPSGSADARAIDAAAIDATAIDATAIDATAIDATAIDATMIDATAIDATAIDATMIDATMIDATAIDATAIDAGTIDAPGTITPDTCAQAQNLTTAALTVPGATVAGTTAGATNDVEPSSACTGYGPDGQDHIYLVTLNAGQTVNATVTPTTSWDISLELVIPCQLTPTTCTGSDAGLAGTAETASYTATAASTVWVVVDSWQAGVVGPYSLNVRIQ